MIDRLLGYWIEIGIALLFATAGIQKLRDLRRFAEVLAAYRVLPPALARPLAGLIPCLELATAVMLVGAARAHRVTLPAMALLILYALGLGINLARGRRDLDCGCTWAKDRPIAAWMVWRNLILAALLAITWLPWSSRGLSGADLMVLAGGLTVMAILYAAIDRLLGEVMPRTLALRRLA